MPRACSTDLRARVVGAVEEGMPHHRVAELFQVGIATVVRRVSLWRATGDMAPLKLVPQRVV